MTLQNGWFDTNMDFLFRTSWCHTDIDPFLSGRTFFVSLRDEVNMACSQSQVLRLFSISDPLVPWGEVVSLQKPNPDLLTFGSFWIHNILTPLCLTAGE